MPGQTLNSHGDNTTEAFVCYCHILKIKTCGKRCAICVKTLLLLVSTLHTLEKIILLLVEEWLDICVRWIIYGR